MSEVIVTSFSPKDNVKWERSTKDVTDSSDHIVSAVLTETLVQVKFASIKGGITLLESIWFSLKSAFTINRVKSSNYGKRSNNSLKQVREGGYVTEGGLNTIIKYRLEGVDVLVPENELTLIK